MFERLRQFTKTVIKADVSHLGEGDRAALDDLIAAARLLDPIFDRQAHRANPSVRKRLAADTSPEGKAKLAYFDIMRGPWDRQDHHRAFATDGPRPPGAGFYPEDLTGEDFKKYVAANPGERDALEGLFTVVERHGDRLRGVPYHQAYSEWLVPAADRLRAAAAKTSSPSLGKFLRSRADALGTDDYYESDKDWMDVEGPLDVTFGPYETYEDELLGLKASYEAFIAINDPVASQNLTKYKSLLPAMEANLPIPDDMKTVRGRESPIRVVDLVYSAGDARKSVQTIAFNLPNDERVRAEKGAKKVLLRNLIEAKFDRLMRPIAERILDPSQLDFLSADAFFNETLFHELSHSLGPAFTRADGREVEVRVALGASYSPIEEAKADVMGCYDVLYLIDQGGYFASGFREKILVSYFAGLFRSTRFGLSEAHGRGGAVQINRFLEEGAARFDERTGRFTVDVEQLERSITSLVRDICELQHRGDKRAADAMLDGYGVVSPPLARATASVSDLPVDLRPIYPIAGEVDE